MLDNLRRDAARLHLSYPGSTTRAVIEALAFNNGFQAVVLHRLGHWFKARRIPALGPAIARLNLFLTGVDIHPAARFGPGLLISHGTGLVVGGAVEVGEDALILHGVTLGSLSPSRVGEMPVVGARVFLGAGAKVLGDVRIGDDVIVGPGAIVTADVPDSSRVLASGGVEVTPREPREPREDRSPAADDAG